MKMVLGVIAGMTVAAGIAALNFYLATSAGFDFSTFSFFLVIPVGAMLMAVPAAFVFNAVGWSSRGAFWRGLVHVVLSILLGTGTLGIFHYLLFFDSGLLDQGNSVSSAFTKHFGNLTMSSRYGDYPINDWGIVLGILSYVGSGLGGLIGFSGAALSSDARQATAANKAKQVARLAVLLGMADGELDDDELACGKYVTKLALDTLAERTFGVSKRRAISSLESIFAEARSDIPTTASYADIANECTSIIGDGDKVLSNVIMYGLAAVIAKTTIEELQRDQLILFAYIANQLGVANLKTSEVLGIGHAMRGQILNGTMK